MRESERASYWVTLEFNDKKQVEGQYKDNIVNIKSICIKNNEQALPSINMFNHQNIILMQKVQTFYQLELLGCQSRRMQRYKFDHWNFLRTLFQGFIFFQSKNKKYYHNIVTKVLTVQVMIKYIGSSIDKKMGIGRFKVSPINFQLN